MSAPAAVGASDPCAASEVARTIGNVARSAGDYLDGHPETNQAMTSVLQQPAGPQSVTLAEELLRRQPQGGQRYADDRVTAGRAVEQCKMPISLPQVLGLMQAAQGAGSAAAVPGAASAVLRRAECAARRCGRRARAPPQLCPTERFDGAVQVSRSSSAGGSGPCRALGASMTSVTRSLSPRRRRGRASFSVRNMKKNTTQPIAASSNQLISR